MPSRAGVKWSSFKRRGSSPSTLKHLSLQISDVQALSLQWGQGCFSSLTGADGFPFTPWQSGMWSWSTTRSTEALAGVAANEARGAIATQSATSTDDIFRKTRNVRLAMTQARA